MFLDLGIIKMNKFLTKKDDNAVKVLIECNCHSEILKFSYWKDSDMYLLTMYKSSFGRGFLWRLKQAWRYFRKGEFEGNGIVLYKDELNNFIDELIKHRPKI